VCTSALHTTRGMLDVVAEVVRRGAQRALAGPERMAA
jgi:hypothetical protein